MLGSLSSRCFFWKLAAGQDRRRRHYCNNIEPDSPWPCVGLQQGAQVQLHLHVHAHQGPLPPQQLHLLSGPLRGHKEWAPESGKRTWAGERFEIVEKRCGLCEAHVQSWLGQAWSGGEPGEHGEGPHLKDGLLVLLHQVRLASQGENIVRRSPAAQSALGRFTWQGRLQPSWWNKTFNACVLNGDLECHIGGNRYRGENLLWHSWLCLCQTRSELLLSYFCGYGPGCSDAGSLSSLQRAKTAVEQQYSVVGVSEKRKISLAVMEAFLPIWFRQATSMEEKRETKREMVNSHPEPSEQTRAELKTRLELDYNFYYFCIQRLEMQWNSIFRDRNKNYIKLSK